jgi:hypothetical protein
MSQLLDQEIFDLFVACQSGKVTCRLAAETVEQIVAIRPQWIQGEPPLEKIVLLWNGKAIYGPISFYANAHLDLWFERAETMHDGRPTHYLIIPKCE